jgi:hypothetical protein
VCVSSGLSRTRCFHSSTGRPHNCTTDAKDDARTPDLLLLALLLFSCAARLGAGQEVRAARGGENWSVGRVQLHMCQNENLF